MNPFEFLGLTDEATPREVKRAYAVRLKQCRPDDDAKGFQLLYEAYESALAHAQREANMKGESSFDSTVSPTRFAQEGDVFSVDDGLAGLPQGDWSIEHPSDMYRFASPLRTPFRKPEDVRWTLPASWSASRNTQEAPKPRKAFVRSEDLSAWVDSIMSMARTAGIEPKQLRYWLDHQPELESLGLKKDVGRTLSYELEKTTLSLAIINLLTDWFGLDSHAPRQTPGNSFERALLRRQNLRWFELELTAPTKRWSWVFHSKEERIATLQRRTLHTLAAPRSWYQRPILWLRAATLAALLDKIDFAAPGLLSKRIDASVLRYARGIVDVKNPFPLRLAVAVCALCITCAAALGTVTLLESLKSPIPLHQLLLFAAAPILWAYLLQEWRIGLCYLALVAILFALDSADRWSVFPVLIATALGVILIKRCYASAPTVKLILPAAIYPLGIAALSTVASVPLIGLALGVLGYATATGARLSSFAFAMGTVSLCAFGVFAGTSMVAAMLMIASFPGALMATDAFAARGNPARWSACSDANPVWLLGVVPIALIFCAAYFLSP